MRLDLLTVPTKGIWDPTEEEEEEDKDDSTMDDDGSATNTSDAPCETHNQAQPAALLPAANKRLKVVQRAKVRQGKDMK